MKSNNHVSQNIGAPANRPTDSGKLKKSFLDNIKRHIVEVLVILLVIMVCLAAVLAIFYTGVYSKVFFVYIFRLMENRNEWWILLGFKSFYGGRGMIASMKGYSATLRILNWRSILPIYLIYWRFLFYITYPSSDQYIIRDLVQSCILLRRFFACSFPTLWSYYFEDH